MSETFSKIDSLQHLEISYKPTLIRTGQKSALQHSHPRRPSGSQSGRERGETKVFKYEQKSPWVPTLTELFPKIQADAGS